MYVRGIKPGKSAVMYMCVRGIHFAYVSMIFQLDFGAVPTVLYGFFPILLLQVCLHLLD
jgi:hypothetical protein